MPGLIGDTRWTFQRTLSISTVECVYVKAAPVSGWEEGKTVAGERNRKKIKRIIHE